MITSKNFTEFTEKLERLSNIYKRVKVWILFAENITGNIILATLNEIRNSFDHINRAIYYPDISETEFDEACDHLKRAGYDALEIITIDKLEFIKHSLGSCSPQAISIAYPKYYKEVRPLLSKIEKELAEIRADRGGEFEENNQNKYIKKFEDYEKLVQKLISITDEISDHIPEIRKVQKSFIRSKTLNYILTFLLAIAASLIIYFVTVWEKPKKTQNLQNEGINTKIINTTLSDN